MIRLLQSATPFSPRLLLLCVDGPFHIGIHFVLAVGHDEPEAALNEEALMKTVLIAAATAAASLALSMHVVAQSKEETPSGVATPSAPAASETPPRPLMRGLDALGLGQVLQEANINIYGHAAASYAYNFRNPEDNVNAGRVFDIEHDDITFNQLDITLERTVDPSKGRFDIGARVEWIWGGDGRFIHSNGLFDYDFATYGLTSTQDGPDEQIDLNQAYVDLAIPIGNGLRVRAGKYVSPIGYETINPSTTPFYSRSYLFGFAVPFTHTGITGTYQLNDNWQVEAGVFRGWEQSLEDNNDAISFQGKLAWTSTDKAWSVTGQVATGPEQTDNESDYRTLFDVIVTYTANDKLSFAANADYGFESDAAADGGNASWYGIAGYAAYKIDSRFTLNGRVEWFNDDDGARGLGTDVYEVTAGLAIRPFASDEMLSNLLIRPEIRADFASDEIFDGGTEDTQITAGIDIIFTF
ncbi:MAG: porin [Planctomycetaceae bacterium]|nr:porin [Planctomycetaceae bacterium]